MRNRRTIILFVVMVTVASAVEAQPRHVKKAIRKKERQERRDRRAYEKERKRVLKHRFEIQTPEVQQRMKHSLKKAKAYNKQRERSFFNDLLEKRKRRKIKNKRRRR